MSRVFIYAQGKGSRWKDSGTKLKLPSDYKQLIPIGKELLIQRTVRQFNQHDVIVFAKHNVYCNLFPLNAKVYELKEPTGSIIDGFLTTAPHWKDGGTSLLLLGDVIFENSVAQHLSEFSSEDVTIFGRMTPNSFTGKNVKEIFAVALPDHVEKKQRFFALMVNFINMCSQERPSKKLWDLWGYIVERGLSEYKFRDYSGVSFTDDIDSPEGYYAFGEKLIQLALEDDKRFVLAQENQSTVWYTI